MLQLADQTAGPAHWWWSTLTSGQGLACLGLIVACLVVLVLCGWRLRQAGLVAGGARPTLRQRMSDESGTATIEFVLVAPFLLFATLVLIQATLVFTGLFYVNYAAFAATRSAIVYIPMDYEDEPNVISAFEGGAKFDRIHGAAVVALIPVSGEESGDFDAAQRIVEGVRSAYEGLGQDSPGWVDNMLADRVNYAANHTEITLYEAAIDETGNATFYSAGYDEWGVKDAVAVEVRHEFALTVPVASRLFAAVGDAGTYTTAARDSDSPGPPGHWTAITARYLLNNEGIDRRLPEAPPVPRFDG